MEQKEVLAVIRDTGVVPVVVLEKIENTLPVLRALAAGGVKIAEITFRTECAEEAIRLAAQKLKDMLVGAGTVINAEQCERAIKAGAKFIVSPGFSAEVALCCRKNNILYVPGTVTPTEIMEALSFGLKVLKYFPAENYGGLKAVKALSAAFPQVSFVPTGGINGANLQSYISFGKIVACGGSWMLQGGAEEITKACKEAVAIVKEARA